MRLRAVRLHTAAITLAAAFPENAPHASLRHAPKATPADSARTISHPTSTTPSSPSTCRRRRHRPGPRTRRTRRGAARRRPRLRDLPSRPPKRCLRKAFRQTRSNRRTRHHALQLGRLRLPAGPGLPAGRGRKRRRQLRPGRPPAQDLPGPRRLRRVRRPGRRTAGRLRSRRRHRTGAPHEGDTKTPADDRHRHGAATGQAPRKDNGPQAILNLVYQLGRGLQGYARQKKH